MGTPPASYGGATQGGTAMIRTGSRLAVALVVALSVAWP
jgi:hypothetical protein